jgi:nitrite reductase/ring-hydroxylating ferredoxin subunit
VSTFVKVGQTSDLAEGSMVAVTVGDVEILLARVQGQYYALSNVCSHADAWLDQGDLRHATWEVQCPLHEGRFDLRTGRPTAGPPNQPVQVYAVRVEGEDILVDLPSG